MSSVMVGRPMFEFSVSECTYPEWREQHKEELKRKVMHTGGGGNTR